MITIIPSGKGFRVQFKWSGMRPTSYYARDMGEVYAAIDHFEHDRKHSLGTCPVCRKRQKDQRERIQRDRDKEG